MATLSGVFRKTPRQILIFRQEANEVSGRDVDERSQRNVRDIAELHVKLVVDEVLCAGHAVCEEAAPDLFRVGPDGIAKVLVESVPEEALERAKVAVLRCPAEAIRLVR